MRFLSRLAKQSFHKLCSTRGGAAAGDLAFQRGVRCVSMRGHCMEQGRRRAVAALRVLHEGGGTVMFVFQWWYLMVVGTCTFCGY
ncbi:hypothetical protein Taro_012183 [Colocasia esculenta]|uniref:Uncharacterized protein n=1 Tax=Colocasia esculenta TaxID=4460 RepID=A0A843UCT4_COLES|nr:hypothetical protein [Colocasia esculenta]